MNWRTKARIQNAIASLPFGSGAVYYRLQRMFGGLRKGLNTPGERFLAAIRIAEWIETAGATVVDKRFVEVGTGHMVNVPTALWLMGASETVTVDLNPYLSATLVNESMDYIREHAPEIRAVFGRRADNNAFHSRLEQLIGFSGDLDELLAMMNVRYLCPGDAAALPLPDHAADFHISNTVLEHIPRETLIDILAEAKRILVRGGMLVHVIDPSDHFSHDDAGITSINCLRFSEDEWNRWAGNRFMYQNRLRASDYLEIFRNAGVNILRTEARIDPLAADALKRGFPVNKAFSGMSEADLATRELTILGTFSD
jgi:SAM-dependent methyltransferase